MPNGKAARQNALFYACFIMLGLYISSYQSMVDKIASEFQMGLSLMGVIVAMHFVGSVVAPPLMGRLSDRKGERVAISISMALIVLGLIVLVLGRGRIAMVVGIWLVGCGYAAVEGLMTSALAQLNPDRVERAINRSQMWFCVGAVAGPLLSVQGIRLLGGWRANILVMAVLFAAITIGLAGMPLKSVASDRKQGPLRLGRSPVLVALCVAIALYVGVEQGIAFFMGSYYTASSAEWLSEWALSSYWAGMIVGRMASSLVRENHRLITVMGLCCAMIALPVTILLGVSPASVVLFGLTGLLIAATWPTLTALAAKRYPAHGATAMGYMMTAGALGGSLFPVIMGKVAEGSGVGASLWMMPVLLALVIGLLMLVPKLD